MPTRRRDALAGVVAAALALGTGELVAGLDDGGPSLVTAVGDEFIDRFAGSLKDLAVELFGTNDKVALVVGIVAVSLVLGGVLGVVSRRRRWVGPAGLVVFGAIGFLALRRAALSDDRIAFAAAVVATGAGIAALVVLLDRSERVPAVAADGQVMGGAPRRDFLLTSAGLAAGAGAAALVGRRLGAGDPTAQVRAETVIPAPGARTTVPPAQPFSEPGLSPYVTPTDDFFRIDTALTVPRVAPESWRLTVDGLVERPFSLTYDELLAMDAVEEPITLQCVSNEVGGDLVGNAVWQGVPLAVLLDRAGPTAEATQVLGRSVDGWTAGFPTELVGDGRTAMVAYAMNGELLRPRHGFPARLVVGGLYGYVSATKWLERIELTRFDEVDGYWIPRGWAKEGPVKTASRIDVPRRGQRLAAGPTPVAGVAWAPTRGVAAVEVQVDDGAWMPCRLGEAASDQTWVQWHLVWDARPGEHVLRVRAVDGTGEVQTSDTAPPAPDGATGHHARRVEIT